MIKTEKVFKAYDIRGLYPSQVNEDFSRKIGSAFATVCQPKTVAVGRDVRASGESLKKELIKGLLLAGVDVIDIGTITTDQLYFAVGNYGYDGGISVTASHNPGEYNGFKFALRDGAPPSAEDLEALEEQADKAEIKASHEGKLTSREIIDDYVSHVLNYIDTRVVKPFKVVANANFGAAGQSLDKIESRLGIKFCRLNWNQDGSFPKGPPNPLLPKNRDETIALVKAEQPDLGVAWDADADRCFFFTGDGLFIPSCYIIALIAQSFLAGNPGSKIIYDLTSSWVIRDAVDKAGGQPISSQTGHTFIKRLMRQENAIFAGESSGHYYFRDSFYADNGIVPFLLILEVMSKTGQSLAELVKPLMQTYKVSGEINFEVENPKTEVAKIEARFGSQGQVDKTDGLVVEAKDWRFSVRPSNTEPLFRLNAEAHDQAVLDKLVKEISALIT